MGPDDSSVYLVTRRLSARAKPSSSSSTCLFSLACAQCRAHDFLHACFLKTAIACPTLRNACAVSRPNIQVLHLGVYSLSSARCCHPSFSQVPANDMQIIAFHFQIPAEAGTTLSLCAHLWHGIFGIAHTCDSIAVVVDRTQRKVGCWGSLEDIIVEWQRISHRSCVRHP